MKPTIFVLNQFMALHFSTNVEIGLMDRYEIWNVSFIFSKAVCKSVKIHFIGNIN